MNYSKHCDLCKNEQTNLKNGLTCSLTNRKPNFKDTCSKINLNEKFQKKIENINLELENRRKEKSSVLSNFYFLIVIGFTLIIGGFYFFKSNTKSVYAMQFSFGFISVGITFLTIAYNKLNKFRREIYNAEFDKYELDDFLEKYGIEYKTEINFKEKIHGTQEVIVKVEYKNWKQKRTTTPYKINC